MSVLIKGFYKPEQCCHGTKLCPFVKGNGDCKLNPKSKNYKKWDEQYAKCPLSEVKDEAEDEEIDIKIGGKYRHFKGGLYYVIGIAIHSETLEKQVVYKPSLKTRLKRWLKRRGEQDDNRRL